MRGYVVVKGVGAMPHYSPDTLLLQPIIKWALLDQALLKEVALQVVQQGLLSNWRFYAALLALSLISGAAGAFLSKYFGKRAETAAVDADLKKILRQLEKTTEVAEQVRSKVDHADWVAREWKTIRRTKLEELVQSAFSFPNWLHKQQDAWLVTTAEEFRKYAEIRKSPNPANHVIMLTDLYFIDELNNQRAKLLEMSTTAIQWLSVTSKDLRGISGEKFSEDEIIKEWNEHLRTAENIVSEITTEASEIMRKERDGMIATNTGN